MPIQIYNSFKKAKEFLPTPSQQKILKIYTCGVTVYDQCHIGHARSLCIFDVIRRYLKYRGYDVQFVRNITDIDDKIIQKGKETKRTFEEVVKENIDFYQRDLKALNLEPADIEPRATENIDDMIKDIEGLVKKDFAYFIDGDVYYRVRRFQEYGRLSGQSIEKMLEGVRVDPSDKKEDPLDFALWKKSKEGEPYWESPWGKGRPGWHIECSCMSRKFLKTDTLDIHAGGRDLIFPHHENEIAQAQALTGKPFARYWIHHGLLTINGQKMAKSLGNFITIQDALKEYGSDVFKLFFLSSHYSSPIDFSEEKMREAKKAYERIDILLKKLDRKYGTRDIQEVASGGIGVMGEFEQRFQESMDDDFNTPKALGVLFDAVSFCNKLMDGHVPDEHSFLHSAMDKIQVMAWIFGLNFFKEQPDGWSDREIETAIESREQCRKQKKFQEADKIRKTLEQNGIILEDTKEGPLWRRKL